MIIELDLPFPPSINHYYHYTRTRNSLMVHIGDRGVKYRKDVKALVIDHKVKNGYAFCFPYFPLERLNIEFHVFPPDKRRRDLDNLLKCANDSMQHADVFKDDSQIDKLIIERHHVIKGGAIKVLIKPYSQYEK